MYSWVAHPGTSLRYRTKCNSVLIPICAYPMRIWPSANGATLLDHRNAYSWAKNAGRRAKFKANGGILSRGEAVGWLDSIKFDLLEGYGVVFSVDMIVKNFRA